MTITTPATRVAYAGDGASVNFAIPFPFFGPAELAALTIQPDGITVTNLVLNGNYTVSGGNDATGTLTMTAPVAAGVTLLIYRFSNRTQLTDLEANDNMPAAALEMAFDRLAALEGEDLEYLNRTIHAPVQDGALGPLPPASLRRLQMLGFDGSGNPIAAQPASALVSAAMQPVVAAATIGAAQSLLGIFQSIPSVESFGAVPFPSNLVVPGNVAATLANITAAGNVVDCTAAFQAAINSGQFLIPAKNYLISGQLTVTGSLSVVGAGSILSALWTTDTAHPIIQCNVQPGSNYYWKGFSLRRLHVAGAQGTSAHGINWVTTTSNPTGIYEDLDIRHSYVGYNLGDANFFTLHLCNAYYNRSHGFAFQNAVTNTLQYQLLECMSQCNGGWGYVFEALANPSNNSQFTNIFLGGPLIGNYSFGNSGGGMLFQSALNSSLADINVTAGVNSNNGNNGIACSTCNNISISNVFIEGPGMHPTGEGQTGDVDGGPAVPPSLVGYGIFLDGLCTYAKIINNYIDTPANGGIASGANSNLISGNQIKFFGGATPTNGLAYPGIAIEDFNGSATGFSMITGNVVNGGNTAGAVGSVGINTVDPHTTVVVGNDLTGNTLGGVPTPLNYSPIGTLTTGNLGANMESTGVAAIPAGSLSVTVPHFLQFTPSVVLLTNTGPVAAGTQVYANGYGPTTFEITLTQVQPSTITINWLANCGQFL